MQYFNKNMTSIVYDGNLRMMHAYNRHGREQDCVVQITCEAAVEEGFQAAMRKDGIELLPQDYDPLRLTRELPERGTERETM